MRASRDAGELLPVLAEGAEAARAALEAIDVRDRRHPGPRAGQYAFDLVADEAVCAVLRRAGLPVLSEESGRSGPTGDLLVVVDPVDGSTNASLGIPWYSTSLCVLDVLGPLVAMVVHHASGARFCAVRGGGAHRDGHEVHPSSTAELGSAVIGISGFPETQPGWGQFRALGAASLDMCAVAEGALDGYCVVGRSGLSGWDYLGALLVCTEAGAVAGERDGLDLVVRDATPRRPVVAATRALMEALQQAPNL